MGYATAAKLLKASERSDDTVDLFDFPEEKKREIIENYLANGGGSSLIFGLMRRRYNYTDLARKIFTVEPLPQGAIPVYSKPDEDK